MSDPKIKFKAGSWLIPLWGTAGRYATKNWQNINKQRMIWVRIIARLLLICFD